MRMPSGTIVITVIILLIITAVTIFGFLALKRYTNQLDNLLGQVDHQVKDDNWDQVVQLRALLQKKWAKALTFFPALVDHAELHDLDISLYRIFSLIDLRKKDEIITELAVARKLVNNVYDQELLTLRNIF